jgi:hypothetical protein
MKKIAKVLAVLGALFVCIILLIGALLFLQSDFQGEHEAFVRQFMSDYSRRWDTADVHDRLSTAFLAQVGSPNAEQALSLFRRLGKVQEITDVSVENFLAGTNGKSGVFVFKADFENSPALVRLTLKESGGEIRVDGLHITPSTEPPLLGSSHRDL